MKFCVNSCSSIWLTEPACICHINRADGEGLEEGDSMCIPQFYHEIVFTWRHLHLNMSKKTVPVSNLATRPHVMFRGEIGQITERSIQTEIKL